MKSKLFLTLIAGAALAGCASVEPEYRMVPSGEHGVGVRFSRGNAAMISNGPAGAVMLLPVRYVRRQNIRHNSRRRLAECGPRQGVDVRRRTCGAASADVRWSVA